MRIRRGGAGVLFAAAGTSTKMWGWVSQGQQGVRTGEGSAAAKDSG